MEQFQIQYGGTVENIAIELDMNSRSKVMRIIDMARAKGQLMRFQPYQHSALLRLSSSGFKILTNDDNQDVLIRMPIHQVAFVSYLYEDEQHIIAIKYGEVDSKKNNDMEADEDLICHMVVAFCESKDIAISICASMEQFFEDTFQRERVTALLRQGSSTNHINNRQDMDQQETQSSLTQPSYSFLSNSCKDLSGSLDLPSTPKRASIDSTGNESLHGSNSQLSNIEQKLIMDYMKKLYNVLDAKELEEFARLVKAWHCDMTFDEFCSRLLDLYGPEKRYLLAGMWVANISRYGIPDTSPTNSGYQHCQVVTFINHRTAYKSTIKYPIQIRGASLNCWPVTTWWQLYNA